MTDDAIPRGLGGEAIAAAAREVFAERGYHGASIRDIAKRAGLSLSAMYYWHASKQDLLAAMLTAGHHEYLEACTAALDAAGPDPADRLVALVRATVSYRVRRRVESLIAAQEWRNLDPVHAEPLVASRQALTRLWARIVEEGVRAGAFDCPHPEDARRSIQAACNAISQWYDPAGDVSEPELEQRYADIALRIVEHRGG
ncbi:TetR/AcrR family transcriptional regulator [Pseudonocardia sp. GCM10023141]|uniref:TetR/AcrR family transcriptional regulator n=1 Tax=Pseudonocardia sp. GCM10023141 TaxID=3252653 RepID=UPI003608B2D5